MHDNNKQSNLVYGNVFPITATRYSFQIIHYRYIELMTSLYYIYFLLIKSIRNDRKVVWELISRPFDVVKTMITPDEWELKN